ncbi:hypothetical protein [Alloalcanivorax marinus]|uniref:hypothetical protein n=1 Tax=Alloalcanivorax marinus TaxID=1177169 RepID=UPI0021CE65FE|nr:hypothetical protein [Alloalcanivorax marinus]
MELIDVGLGKYDIALLILCPLGALIGSFAFAITATISDMPPKKESQAKFASSQLAKARGAWLMLRLMLGAILGLLLGLYFIGAIQETPSTLAKVVALSIIAGYAAPKMWLAQDKVISAQIERVVKAELSKFDETSTPNKQRQSDA